MIILWEGNEISFQQYLLYSRKVMLTEKGVKKGYQLVCVCVDLPYWMSAQADNPKPSCV